MTVSRRPTGAGAYSACLSPAQPFRAAPAAVALGSMRQTPAGGLCRESQMRSTPPPRVGHGGEGGIGRVTVGRRDTASREAGPKSARRLDEIRNTLTEAQREMLRRGRAR